MKRYSKEEIIEWRNHPHRIMNQKDAEIIQQLLSDNEEMEKALEFYANDENWEWQETPATEDEYIPARHDGGDLARTTLGKIK